MFITVVVSVVCALFGKKILKWIWDSSRITIDTISKDEAALVFLERQVTFQWRPQIVEEQMITNISFDN